MKHRSLWRISVTTSFEAEEAVTEMLGALLGQPVSAYADAETGRTTVSAYCAVHPANAPEVKSNLRAGLKRIRACGLEVAPGKVFIAKMHREVWAHSWKRHFRPLEIASVLLVKPSWNRRKPNGGQKLVVLDPGLSFGTGQHPTTRYCLNELVKRRSQLSAPAKSFLDLGTGSGILAIAAAKLGYTAVQAIDFDPEAIRAAKTNAKRNKVSGKISIIRRDLTCLPRETTKKYDFVCANLISTLLIAERDRILARLQEGGVLVLAGILKSEFSEVERTYEAAGLKLVRSRAEKEWCSGTFRRVNQKFSLCQKFFE